MALPIIAISETIKYHVFWANNPHQAESFESTLIDDSNYIKTLPANSQVIVIAENMQRIPIKLFNYNNPNIKYSHQDELDKFLADTDIDTNNITFILTGHQEWVAEKLINTYPDLKLQLHPILDSPLKNSVWVITK
jgi:folate-dependent phosphoribosylglycinamide formyltransferase PurN